MMPCILCWVIAAIVSVTGPIVFEYNDVIKYCTLWLDETEVKVTVLHNNVPRMSLLTDRHSCLHYYQQVIASKLKNKHN